MSMIRRVIASAVIAASVACGGGSPSGPSATAPPPPVLTSPAAPTSQSGCSATYTCPNVPGITTIDRVTLATGTSPSCRAPVPRNTGSNGNLQVEITIRNPQPNWFWANGGPGLVNPMGGTPPNGSAATVGPHQMIAGFNDIGVPIVTGLEFTTVLRLYTFTGQTVQSTCEIQVFGNVPRS